MPASTDRLRKRCKFVIQCDNCTSYTGKYSVHEYEIGEKDDVDLEYINDKDERVRVYGKVLKVGVDPINRKEYITVILYDFTEEDNIHFIYIHRITKVTNVNHTKETASFGPVISADESIILLKEMHGRLMYSGNGKTWRTITSGSGGGDASNLLFDIMIEKGYTGTMYDLADLLIEYSKNHDNIVTREFKDL